MTNKFYQARIWHPVNGSVTFDFASYSEALKFEMRVTEERPDLTVSVVECIPHTNLDYAMDAVNVYFER